METLDVFLYWGILPILITLVVFDAIESGAGRLKGVVYVVAGSVAVMLGAIIVFLITTMTSLFLWWAARDAIEMLLDFCARLTVRGARWVREGGLMLAGK